MASLFPNCRIMLAKIVDSIRETAVSQIPWGHNIMLLQRVDTLQKRLWYASYVGLRSGSFSFFSF